MKKLFEYASMIVSSVPGLIGLFGGFTLPPVWKWIFASAITLVPPLFILMLLVYWLDIRKKERKTLIKWGYAGLGTFFACLIAFVGIHSYCIVEPTNPAFDPKPVLFPLWLTGEIEDRVNKQGGRLAFVNKFGPDTAHERISAMNGYGIAKLLTFGAMLLLFLLSSSAIASSFAIFGMYLTDPKEGPISVPERNPLDNRDPPALSEVPMNPPTGIAEGAD